MKNFHEDHHHPSFEYCIAHGATVMGHVIFTLWVTNPNQNIIDTFSLLFNLKESSFLEIEQSKKSVNGP